jgi:2-succinyl-5-enolpyruvyl-6-hydroxy-3-cyclohexene-1-carboxylate synthase
VLRVGDLPTSKPLREWLARAPGEQVAIDPEGAWQDPSGVVGTVIAAEPGELLAALPAAGGDPAWLQEWRRADAAAAQAIAATLGSGLSEPAVAAELGARLPGDATLFVASSMPVRDVETFLSVRDAPPRVLSNRGANGIDGTASTAFGIAAASSGPVVLLTGDVALAHDIGGLLAATRTAARLTIVLIDNDGGGIFNFLPVAEAGPEFEPHVATPHGLDFAHAAALYGLGWEPADDRDGFRAALQRALGADRSTIVRVRTDRGENVRLHRRVWESVRAAA